MNSLKYTEEQLLEKYNNLPEDIREIILDENFGAVIQIIGKDHKTTPVQALDIENLVLHILLGINPVHNLAEQIQEKLNIPKETAQKIMIEIDENIFSGVGESLEKIQPSKEEIKKPNLPTNEEKSELASVIPKKVHASVKAPAIPPPPAPPNPIVPQESNLPSQPPKSIVGAEKIGMGILAPMDKPAPESPNEHLFEKKLREVVQPPTTPKQAEKPSTEKVSSAPSNTQPEKIDPYRE